MVAHQSTNLVARISNSVGIVTWRAPAPCQRQRHVHDSGRARRRRRRGGQGGRRRRRPALADVQHFVAIAARCSAPPQPAEVPATTALAYETLLSPTTVGDASGGTSRIRTCVVAISVAMVAEGVGAGAAHRPTPAATLELTAARSRPPRSHQRWRMPPSWRIAPVHRAACAR